MAQDECGDIVETQDRPRDTAAGDALAERQPMFVDIGAHIGPVFGTMLRVSPGTLAVAAPGARMGWRRCTTLLERTRVPPARAQPAGAPGRGAHLAGLMNSDLRPRFKVASATCKKPGKLIGRTAIPGPNEIDPLHRDQQRLPGGQRRLG